MHHCLFCKTAFRSTPKLVSDQRELHCDNCGVYNASGTLAATEIEIDKPELTALQAFIHSENEQDRIPNLHNNNWKKLTEPHGKPTLGLMREAE